jgi:hypothetical protein
VTPAPVLADLRARFVLKTSRPGDFEGAPTAVSTPVLGASEVDHFDGASGALAPILRVGGAKARGKLAATADGASTLTDAASGVTVSIAPRGFASSVMQVIDGYTLGIGAGPAASTVVATGTSEGIEDWVVFGAAPPDSSLKYEVTLGAGVAGVRLVERTLELLDAKGTPRLRMRPPLLVDAKGAAHPVDVRIEGCAFDASPMPPWGRAVTAPGTGSCVVALSWASASPAYPIAVDPSWTTTGSLAYGRGQHTGTRLADGRVLAVGGYAPVTPVCEVYDPSTGTWAVTGNNLTPRFSHAAALLDDGRVLVAGGYRTSDWALQQTAEVYSPSTGTWSSVASMSSTRENFSLTRLSNGKVLAAAGYAGGSSFRRTAELFDPSTGTWSGTGLLAVARAAHAASLLPNGKVLVTGGQNTSYLASAELWDPATNAWSSAGTMSTVRSWHAQVTMPYGGKALVAGGHVDGTYTTPSVQLYDIATNAWSSAPSMSTGRAKFGAALLPNAQVLLAAGQSQWNVFTAAADAYESYPAATTATSGLVTARSNFALVALKDSFKALAVGGYTSTQYLTSAELYDASSPPETRSDLAEQVAVPAFSIGWDDPNPRGTWSAASSLSATVRNNTDQPRRVYIDLLAHGLDERAVTRSEYFDLLVPANATQTVQVPLSAIPIRSVGTESEVLLRLREYVQGQGPTGVTALSDERHYEFAAGYASAILYGAHGKDLDRVQPTPSTTPAAFLASTRSTFAGLAPVVGQVFTAAGGFVDVSTLATQANGSRAHAALTGQWAVDLNNLRGSWSVNYDAPAGSGFYSLCATWRAGFVDQGGGEDFLASGETQPARFASFLLTTDEADPKVVASGYLNAQGCTPSMLLAPNAPFHFTWQARLQKNGDSGINMEIRYGPNAKSSYSIPKPTGPLAEVRAFVTPATGGTYTHLGLTLDTSSRIAATLGEAMRKADTGMKTGGYLYRAWSNTGCAPFLDEEGLPQEACYDPSDDIFKVGWAVKDLGNGVYQRTAVHNAWFKYIIGHEFGHHVQYSTIGHPFYTYDPKNPQKGTWQAACRCDHVYKGNRSHCMQSREEQGFASVEGFAHFYAAQLFNDTSQSDCRFGYYKDYRAFLLVGWAVAQPPAWVDCTGVIKWVDTWCPTSGVEGKGNEHDWLTFYYDVHRGTNAFSFEDVGRVYKFACGDFAGTTLCNDQKVFFRQGWHQPPTRPLVDAANGLVSVLWTQAKADEFLNKGMARGVDH